MKHLVFAVALIVSPLSFGKVATVDLSYLQGQTLTGDTFDLLQFSGNTEFNNFKQMEVFFDIDEANVESDRFLSLYLFGENIASPEIHYSGNYAIARRSHSYTYNPSAEFDYELEGLSFSMKLGGWDFNESPVSVDEFITFGAGSYVKISDTENEIFKPWEVPETDTFALFLLGAVGLCVRRQMKQQA